MVVISGFPKGEEEDPSRSCLQDSRRRRGRILAAAASGFWEGEEEDPSVSRFRILEGVFCYSSIVLL